MNNLIEESDVVNKKCKHKGRYVSRRIWRCKECNEIVCDWEKNDFFKLGKLLGKEEFKENLLMKKTNHELGCMLECYVDVIGNRLGFTIEAIKLEEIASKLK